jgi:ubiquinone/menaquinone biosynthesis C-methylase UbiE
MAIRNTERSLSVLSQLQLRSTDRVLEIGFGSGVDIKRASERVKEGFVAGLDHSEIMVVFSINVAQFWENPAKEAGEIHRVLKPGGQAALAVQPRYRRTSEHSACQAGDMLGQALTSWDSRRYPRTACRSNGSQWYVCLQPSESDLS